MKSSTNARTIAAFLVTLCLLLTPISVLAKKGEKNFRRGLQYEASGQWDKAAQEFALAVAADPSDGEFLLHYQRALFSASQMYMVQGRSLAEQKDFIGGYNAFRQAYGYDPVNQLALSEMARMLRLQSEKEAGESDGTNPGTPSQPAGNLNGAQITPANYQQDPTQPTNPSARSSQPPQDQASVPLRVINYSGDLKAFIRSLANELNLNVVFDSVTFRQSRNIDVNWRGVTTAQALDYLFAQEGLFFQKLGRRTILVADQTRRPQYQQLVLRTFYLANADPQDAQRLIQQAIPAQAGRPPTIVILDKATNSLTVRDTAENVRLIGELISSIDKDRAEVVMDVAIYEVDRNDLLTFGNQLGDVGTLTNLGGIQSGAVAYLNGIRNGSLPGGVALLPTSLSAALILPASTIQAFQRKTNAKLIASTQIHAFTGEESSARIGQRVPVQTAQTYPFSTVSTDTKNNQGAFPGGGFPVINYEPTGLTLKFTPQVFPNLDVQVKMSIESKDVFGQSLTPTFIERNITGTARIQNNRTMMLVSLAQQKVAEGRSGLPILGLIPILGRLFSAPTTDNQKTDIVISVTPRVLRAPAVTPEDEKLRPSGTLQTPTTGSLEALVIEADREDQLAINSRPRETVIVQSQELAREASTVAPTVAPTYIPAPQSLLRNDPNAAVVRDNPAGTNTVIEMPPPPPANNSATEPRGQAPASTTQTETKTVSQVNQQSPPRALEVASYATAGTQPMMFTQGGALGLNPFTVAMGEPPPLSSSPFAPQAANVSTNENATRVDVGGVVGPPSTGTNVEASSASASTSTMPVSAAELRLVPERQEMRVGEKHRFALILKTDAPLGMAVVTLRFNPQVVAIRQVTGGNLFAGANGAAPEITHSVVPGGMLLVSVVPPAGNTITGAGVLLFLDVEAVGSGSSAISFDKNNMHLIAADGRTVVLQLVRGSEVVTK